MDENPFRSPETTELAPSDRVYEPPQHGGWRPGPLLSAALLGGLLLVGRVVGSL